MASAGMQKRISHGGKNPVLEIIGFIMKITKTMVLQ
jgi:hypothetical protein